MLSSRATPRSDSPHCLISSASPTKASSARYTTACMARILKYGNRHSMPSKKSAQTDSNFHTRINSDWVNSRGGKSPWRGVSFLHESGREHSKKLLKTDKGECDGEGN